ncbi:hypothetical protein NE237_018995 [Protea cynaroides]|uniref:Uncharacterized protein n=1 Tax=Protea cynaroides TaxID=273540 RepID=A0A9Q0GPN5_9MAGN|nr:hypothetical protein NE237_008301 [Protea cynaroides]KAJ4953872.1 hypothetical protein NE237_030704 [Protea cynaroides]KAJ4967146.1 hypothetical protein NE237_018995 [Protea cynaroides]
MNCLPRSIRKESLNRNGRRPSISAAPVWSEEADIAQLSIPISLPYVVDATFTIFFIRSYGLLRALTTYEILFYCPSKRAMRQSQAVENGKKTSAKKKSLPARRKISGHRLLLTLVWRSQLASWFQQSVYSFALDRLDPALFSSNRNRRLVELDVVAVGEDEEPYRRLG